MQTIKHVNKTPYIKSFRNDKISAMFDVEVKDILKKEWQIDIDIDSKKWNIGMIVGRSGAGKTTLAKKIFKDSFFENHQWDNNSIVDNFDSTLSLNEITNILSSVGFSSPPYWLLPYHCLSNGQKFRVDLARAIVENQKKVLVFDEFSSVVDRDVAKIGSSAIEKFVRKNDKQFVAVSCHNDIIEWLDPDWVIDVSNNTFFWRSERRRPEIHLSIFKYNCKIWPIFAGYHYMSKNINPSSQCFYAVYNNNLVGLCSILPFPHPIKKNAWREHRTVVLPDYQGVGIGTNLSNFVGEHLKKQGKQLISTTSHKALIQSRNKSNLWRATSGIRRCVSSSTTKSDLRKTMSVKRYTVSFAYIGENEVKNDKTP